MNGQLRNVMQILLVIFIALVCLVMIREGAPLLADLGHHISNLFKKARLFPGRSGFDEFIQLMLIAVFVGWVISRFKGKK